MTQSSFYGESQVYINVPSLSDTSATPFTIGLGGYTFTTVGSNKAWSLGDWIMVASAAAPTTNWMLGQVSSYSGSTLVLNVQATGGSGLHSDWILSLSGAPGQPTIPVNSNVYFYVAPTGSDFNTGTIGSPFLTVQHAVNVATQYNYQGLYYPVIFLAAGTYANSSVVLPQLTNVLPGTGTGLGGGFIVGNVVTPTSVVLTDNGSAWTFTALSGGEWSIVGVSLNGTYGAFSVDSGATVAINALNFSGNYSQGALNVESNGLLVGQQFPNPSTFTVSASSWAGPFLFSRGIVVADVWTVTFSTPITMAGVINLDFRSSMLAATGLTFTNGTNVTCTQPCAGLYNGAYMEANSATKVDGATLTRSNFPGHASSAVVVDVNGSFFGPDFVASPPLTGQLLWNNNGSSVGTTRANWLDGAGYLTMTSGAALTPS